MATTNELVMKITADDMASGRLKEIASAVGLTVSQLKNMGKTMETESKKMDSLLQNVNFASLGMNEQEARNAFQPLITEGNKAFETIKTKSQDAFDTVSKWAIRAATVLSAFGGYAVKSFADFEYGVTKVQSISRDSTEAISTQVRKLSKETGSSFNDINEALYQTVSSIGDVSGKYEFLGTATKLGVAGFTSTTNAVNLLATAVRTYKLDATEAEKVASQFLVTQNLGRITVDQMVSSYGRLLASAKLVGVSITEINTAMTLLTRGGLSADDAGTALNAMFTELARSGSDAGKAFKSLSGMSFENFLKSGKSLEDALKIMIQYIEKTGDSVFDVFNIRGVKSFAVLKDNMPEYKQVFNELENSSGQLTKSFEQMANTLKGQFSILKAYFKDIVVQLGEALIPKIKQLIQYLRGINFEQVFSKENIDRILSVGKAVLVFAGALKAISITNSITASITAITSSGGAIAALSNPVGLATVAIAGIGMLIYEQYSKWKQYRQAVDDVASSFDIFSKSSDSMITALDKQFQVIDRLEKKMDTVNYKDIDIAGISKQFPDFKEIADAYISARNSYQSALNGVGLPSGNKYSQEVLDDFKDKFDEAEKRYKEYVENLKSNSENNKILITAEIDAESEAKVNAQLKELLDGLSTGSPLEAFKSASDVLANNPNLNQLATAYKSLGSSADEATMKTEILKLMTDILTEDITQVPDININGYFENFNEIMAKITTLLNIPPIKIPITISQNSLESEQNKINDQSKKVQDMLAKINELKTKGVSSVKSQGTGKTAKDEIKELISTYESNMKNMPKFWDMTGISELDQAKQKLNAVQSLMSSLASKNKIELAQSYKSAFDDAKRQVENLQAEESLKKLKDSYNNAIVDMPNIWKAIGLSDTEIIKKQIAAAKKIIEDGLKTLADNKNGVITLTAEVKAKYETEVSNAKENLKSLQAQEKEAQAVEEAKKKEAEASKEIVNVLSNFGSDLQQLGEDLNSTFLEVAGSFVSSMSTILKGMQQAMSQSGGNGFGGILSSITGMFSGGGGLGGIVSGLTSLTGIGTAVSGVVGIASSAISALSGSDKKKKLEEKSKQQEEAYDQATSSLIDLVQSIENAASRITEFSSSMVSLSSVAPTIDRVTKAAGNFDKYINAILINKTFGNLNVLYQDTAKYSSWFSSKSLDVSKNTKMDRKVLDSLGWGNTSIELMGKDELKKLNEQLSSFGKNDLENLLGKDIIKTDLETWKEGIREYVQQIEKLEKAQKELMKNATLSDFSGIDYQSQASLVEQYRSSFEEMGLKADDYMDTINEMANANQVLVTSMQDVRNAYVEALSSGNGTNFSDNMGSYFKALLENAAKVTYDVAYSSIDSYMSNEFSQMSDKLVSMKENGVLNFSGFWDDFNFNKILEGDRIQTQYDTVINDLRLQLESRGFSQSLIDSILPATELSERIESIKDMLNSAMNSAITSGSFDDFSSSLGQSIYDSVKNSLITAFTDSEVYKQYIDRFFNTAEIEQQLNSVSSAQDGFNVIQDYLNNLDYQLQAAGLARGDSLLSTDDTTSYLGNGYYTDTSSGLTIQITQYFTGVYGEQTMYDIAKQGVADGLNEWQTSAGTLGTIGTTSAAVS